MRKFGGLRDFAITLFTIVRENETTLDKTWNDCHKDAKAQRTFPLRSLRFLCVLCASSAFSAVKCVNLEDCKITRLQDYKIARLQDCKITRLQDYKIARLKDYKIRRLRAWNFELGTLNLEL
jgi:hypothetical protein